MRRKKNYLNNKDILKEIHASKLSFSYVLDDCYSRFDAIIEDEEITDEVIATAKENRAASLSNQAYEDAMTEWLKHESGTKPKKADFKVDISDINEEDIVIRKMTFEHIPLEPGRKKNPKRVADYHSRCNFPPFKHFALINGEWREVVRSHWEGGLGNGSFNTQHGKITDELGRMMMKLCERYSMKSNWRGYSYIDEMRSSALVQLSQVGLQFNEARGDNPFAYYTRVLQNAFTSVLNLEKRNQNIRDDILQDAGHMPSFNRQVEDETAQKRARAEAEEAEKQKQELTQAGYNVE